MANKKTVKKRNRKPKIGDIIIFGLSNYERHRYLVLEYREIPLTYHLLNLDTGKDSWYEYEFWMRNWKKIA